jgi:ubiquinone/menaquinone biosynthesis C-methylase UbiE
MFAYFNDEEYHRIFGEFKGIRKKIATLVSHRLDSESPQVLDLLAGHGYLSAELANLCPSCMINGTGLKNDLDSYLALRNSDLYPSSVWENVKYTECDVTSLPFNDDSFDVVVNFLGLEDVMMTHGESGILSAISEIARVLKDKGLVEIAIVEYGDSPEEKVAEEVWANIGLNAVFLPKEFYIEALRDRGIELMEEVVLKIRKKMTFSQAKEELQFACEQAPILFEDYNVSAISFDELMNRFGSRIEAHGMAYYPNIRVLIFSNSGRCQYGNYQ